MRPHLLQFGGIGTYAGDVSVDFDDLSTLGLYLIVGPTGAGKTTIFDALTYALFGRVAGERPLNGIVSDHAHRVEPYVSLTFSHRGARYSVSRKPSTSDKAAKPSDHVFTAFDEHGNPTDKVTGNKKVTDAITELIGLEADQFMKVILLPQNEFQKFLLANSTEKMPLLRALFGTHLYERIAFKLENAAKALFAQSRDAAAEVDNLRNQFDAIVDSIIDMQFLELDAEETYSDDDIISRLDSFVQSAVIEAAAATEAYGLAHSAMSQGESEQNRFDAAHERAELQKILSDSADATRMAARALDSHRRAQPITQSAQSLSEAQKHLSETAAALQTARENVQHDLALLDSNEHLVAEFLGTIPHLEPTQLRQEITRFLDQLAIIDETYTKIASLTTHIESDEARIESAERQIADLSASLDACAQQLTAARHQYDLAVAANTSLPNLERNIEDLNQLIAQADVDSAQAEVALALDSYTAINQQLATAEAQLVEARTNHALHLAGDLALLLQPHQPCPVCGSIEHPQPAPQTSDVDVPQLEVMRDQLLAQRSPIEKMLHDKQHALAAAQTAHDALPTPEEQQSLRHEYDTARSLSRTAPEHETQCRTLETEISALTIQRDEAKSLVTSTRSRIDTLILQRDESTRDIATSLSHAQVRPLQQHLTNTLLIVQALIEAAQQNATADAARTGAQRSLDAQLSSSGFSSVDEALSYVLPTDTLAEFTSLCDEEKNRMNRVLVLDGIIGEAPVPPNRPDVEALREALQNALAKNEYASQRRSRGEQSLESLTTLAKKLSRIAPDSEALRQKATNALNISSIIKSGQGASLPLERWVQRQLFEEVCDVASVQFAALTSNKFQLTLNSDGAKQSKKTAGLDIYVIDSHSGGTRPVSSLSGGETFLTSLALALALAEVVQRHSGGLEMSTLFIDEGFGSLDGDILEIAVDYLRKLQDSGRTIGVISHVESMQHDLPVGIRVASSQSGSSLQVLVQKGQ